MNKKVRVIIETLVVGLLVFLLTIFNVNSSLDYMAKDRLYQIPRGIDSKIKIIGIDEKTMEELGPIQTWSRGNYARLLEKLNENEDAKPALVGFDILFPGNVDEGDDEFARAAAESGNVIIVNHLLYRDSVKKIGNKLIVEQEVDQIEEPYDSLRSVCKAGFSNVAEDSDGVVRRIIPVEKYQGYDQKMFSTVLYEEYCRIMGIIPESIPVDEYGRSIINYSGRPGDYEYISMSDVLAGRIDTRAFKDSIILVGAYAMGMQDNFKVPTSGQQMFGVEIHANILQSYMQNRFAITGDQFLLGIITAVIAMLLYLMFRRFKLWLSLIIMLVTITAEVLVLAAVNNRGYSFSVIYFPIVLILAYIYAIVMNYLLEKARKKKVLNAFKKYVAPEIVDEISKSGEFNVKVGGENRDIAVLFVDIRGFTTMSEALEPEQVVEILNEYLALTTDAIFKNKGTLDKFVGDCTMAVFNSPFDLDDYEFRSVCAAKDIVDGGMALEKTLMEKYGRTVGFGVGVNVGPAVVGNIGCDFRMDFTAIGDTVNTAARLEANAKKGQVLISDVLYERLNGRIEVNPIGEIPLKGKSKGVFVYEVTEVHREDA